MTCVHTAAAVLDDRASTYQQFRRAFDAGEFTGALPQAVRIVELTRNQFGADAPEMINPLSNLATTQLRIREFGPALDNYRRALTLLDLQGDNTNPKLVAPLHGMGTALHGLQRDDEAVVALKRAVDIIRNRDGLHAVAQLPILAALIDCYEVAGRNEDASREHQYAYTIAETAYGKADLRLLGPLQRYARWQETTGRYTSARALYARIVAIADAAQPGSLLAIDGLRGIARSVRLAFIHGESEAALLAADDLTGTLVNNQEVRALASSSESERPLRDALQRLDNAAGDHSALRGAVFTDLGDWYLTGGVGVRALASYRDAWQALTTAGDTRALETPAPVIYRAPSMAMSLQPGKSDEFTEQVVELRLSITANGEIRAATVANPAPEREAAERAVISAARRALWRPAFNHGEPVAASDFKFVERVYIRRAKEPK